MKCLERLGKGTGQRGCARIPDAAEHLGHPDWLGLAGKQEFPKRAEDETRNLVQRLL